MGQFWMPIVNARISFFQGQDRFAKLIYNYELRGRIFLFLLIFFFCLFDPPILLFAGYLLAIRQTRTIEILPYTSDDPSEDIFGCDYGSRVRIKSGALQAGTPMINGLRKGRKGIGGTPTKGGIMLNGGCGTCCC